MDYKGFEIVTYRRWGRWVASVELDGRLIEVVTDDEDQDENVVVERAENMVDNHLETGG